VGHVREPHPTASEALTRITYGLYLVQRKTCHIL